MGTFRKRVNTKGKRWIRGQSSNSNPESKTFRSSARNNFFKEDLSNNTRHNVLTADLLRKHNDLGSNNVDCRSSLPASDFNDDDTNFSDVGSAKTFNTFASDWSCCSNISFNKLLNRFDLSSALHKEMLAVLAAITEVIKANGGTENTTEYFAALITTLEGIESAENEDSVGALLSLLSMCIKRVSRETLQLKFSSICETLTRHLRNFHDSENNTILKSIIGCLSVVLRAQHVSVWKENSKTLDYYKNILEFVTHSKSKIRKAAQHAVCAVLKGSFFLEENPDTLHPASEMTAAHCVKIIKTSFSEGGTTTVLHVLALLKEIIAFFPKEKLRACCDIILQLLTLKQNLITTCGLQTLHGLFISKPSVAVCPATLNAKLINGLYIYQPSATDSQTIIAWATVMQEAFINLARSDLSLCISNCPKIFLEYSTVFLSEKQNVISTITSCMQTVLKECILPAATEINIERYKPEIRKIFELLKSCMKYTYHMAWKSVLYMLATMYRICGRTCSDFMIGYLRELADLRDSEEYAYEKEIDNIFGAAIESIGPEIPLKVVCGENPVLGIKHSWLLPLFKQHIKNSTLKCFVDNFLPLAVSFYEKKKNAIPSDRSTIVTFDLLESQIWALLPSFCRSALDIEVTLPKIKNKLKELLASRSDLRFILLASVRNLILSCGKNPKNEDNSNDEGNPKDEENPEDKRNPKDVVVVSELAGDYLPLLFNIYRTKCEKTNEEAARVSTLNTIKACLMIEKEGLVEKKFFNYACNLLSKCNSADQKKIDFEKEAVLDLMKTFIPYLSESSLTILFNKLIKRIKKKNLHFKEEKKYYRLLVDICSSETEGCKKFTSLHLSAVRRLIIDSESNTHLTSREARIETISALLTKDPSEEAISIFLPEVVLCCKNGNQSCRKSAFKLLNKMAEIMAKKSGEIGVGEFLDKLLIGLVGTTSVISATILALSSVLRKQEDKLNQDHFGEILKNICLLSQSKTREIVGPAIGFIKGAISMPNVNFVQKHLPLIVKSLTGITDDCKRKYRRKMHDLYDKLVRKFGVLTIISLVPTHDGDTLTRLKAIKKEQAQEARKKLEAKEKVRKDGYEGAGFSAKQKPKTINEVLSKSDDESDSDEDNDEPRRRSKTVKGKNNVYLKEDQDMIIDFTAPSACANITMSKPKLNDDGSSRALKKKTKIHFPKAPDGRLIIQEEKIEILPTTRGNVESDDESIASDAEAEGRLSQMLNKCNINRKRKNASNSDDEDEPSTKYQAGGKGIHRNVSKTNKSTTGHSGEHFKAKKASGDIKRKGKPDPYAYIPLSRNSLNRRKKKKSAGKFKHIVQSAKKGADRGAKNRSRANKKK